MTAYYDLNIPWPATLQSGDDKAGKGKQKAVDQTSSVVDKSSVLATTNMLCHLGYAVLAYNVHIPASKFSANLLKACNPCPGLVPAFPQLDPRSKAALASPEKILQLTRLTVVLDGSCLSGKGNGGGFTSANSNVLSSYDLLAAMPTDAAALQHVCTSLAVPSNISIDIISLDLASSAKLPFYLRRSLILGAIKQGVLFEITYGVSMRAEPSSTTATQMPATTVFTHDPTLTSREARRNLFSHTRALAQLTGGGKGLIFSSAAVSLMDLRAPGELTNLLEMLGFKKEYAREAIGDAAKRAVMRGWTARRSWRGVISGPATLLTEEAMREHVFQGVSKKRKLQDNSSERASQDGEARKKQKIDRTPATVLAENSFDSNQVVEETILIPTQSTQSTDATVPSI